MKFVSVGLVLGLLFVVALGCGGGLSESEVEKIVDRAVADSKEGIVSDVTMSIAEDFSAVISDATKRNAELRSSIESDLAQTQTAIMELNDETTAKIAEITTMKVTQYVTAICTSDYKVVTLSIALGTLLDYLAGGESTLDEVAGVLTEGVPIDDRDFYGQYSRVCGITPEGNWYLQPIPAQ